jgi:hypothetical protein
MVGGRDSLAADFAAPVERGHLVTKYPFLSEEWVEEARRIRAEYADRAPKVSVPVRINQIVKGAPFGSGTVESHLDTSAGEVDFEVGHLESPDLTMTIDYDTAKAIFVQGDSQAAMQAFMSGRIKVDGDMTKLIQLQSAGVVGSADPAAQELAKRLQDITE